VQTKRASRELANRRLEAEQKKFAAGTIDQLHRLPGQRDLAVAQNNELRAVLDYNRSLVDLGTVPGGAAEVAGTGERGTGD
jgi:outer membrane protein TolC